MDFKKFIGLIILLSLFGNIFVFANTPGQDAGAAAAKLTSGKSVSNFFEAFGNFYDSLKGKQSSNILDGFAIIIMFGGLYAIFFNLTRFAFKGENNKSARKGASVILSILVTGALITSLKDSEGFVSYYGGMIIFLLTSFTLIFGYIAYSKWVLAQIKHTGGRIALLALGLVVIDITLSSIIGRLFETYSKGLVFWVSESIGAIASFAMPLIFVGLLWWALIKGDSSDDKIEKAVESEEDKIKKNKIAKVKALTKSYANSLKSGFDSSKKKREKLKELNNLINGGL